MPLRWHSATVLHVLTRAEKREVYLALLAILVVAGGIWFVMTRPRPSHDVELAERSFLKALQREHPQQRRLAVSCTGQRDGSDFFGCEIQSAGPVDLPTSTSVAYRDSSETYRAEDGAGPSGESPIVFRPAD